MTVNNILVEPRTLKPYTGFSPPSKPATRSRSLVLSVVLVALVASVAYSYSSNAYFLADDFVALNQLALKQTSLLDNLAWFGRDWGIGADFYRPLVRLGYYFQYLIFSDNAAGWHCFSIGLHALNTILVLGLGYLLSRRVGVGCVAGLLFALQPIHSEPVAWISGQTDLWATFFCLAATLCFVRLRQNQESDGNKLLWRLSALVFFGLALCSKETAAALPAALLAYDFITGGFNRGWFKGQPRAGRFTLFLLNHAPFWILFGIYITWRIILFKGLGGYVVGSGQQPDLLLFLRSNLRWLCAPFSLAGTDGLTFLLVVAAFVVLTGVQEWELFGVFSQKPALFLSLRTAAYGVVWIIIFLIPAALVQPAERFTYLPSVGLALFGGAILAPFLGVRQQPPYRELVWWLRIIAIGTVLLIYLAATTGRVNAWVQAGNTAQKFLQNTKAVISEKDLPHYSYLYGENLPDDAAGAYLFRTGYAEAMQWLYRDLTLTAFKVSSFPIIEDHLGQTIFLEYKSDGNIVNHLQVQSALQERARNLKNQRILQSWDFNSLADRATVAGWYATDGSNQVPISEGNLQPNSAVSTHLQNNNLNLPALQLGVVEVTLKITAQPGANLTAQALWETNRSQTGQSFETDPSSFNLMTDGNYHTYRISPQILPHNQNGQLNGYLGVQAFITTVRLEFPTGITNIQIQKIVQYQIPSSYTLPLN